MARALNVLPDVKARLEGCRADLGFSILLCPKSGAGFSAIFESIGNAAQPLAPNVTQVMAH